MKMFLSKLKSILSNIFLTLAITTAVTALLLFIFLLIMFGGPPKSYDITFADNAVIEYHTPNFSFVKEMSNEDLEELKQIVGRGWAWHDTPACPFGDVRLLLSASSKELPLYPAGDDCNMIMFIYKKESYFFSIKEDDDYSKLKTILEEYGVQWPNSV